MPKYKKILLPFSIFLVLIVFLGLLTLVFYNYSINKSTKSDLNISITKGMSKTQVLQKVCNTECSDPITKNMLKVFLYFNKNLVFEVGEYKISANTPFTNLFKSFKNGTTQQKITLLEGWSVYENAYYLKQNVNPTFSEEYLKLAEDLEGYLYPNTYFIDLNTTPQSLIDLQTNQFNKSVGSFVNSNGLSKEEVVKIASIVEREGLNDLDRPIIAGILIKRYLQDMPLDADATSQYGLFLVNYPNFIVNCLQNNCTKPTFWTKDLNLESLKLNQQYNTRGSLGLPPKPICNPSLSSVKAVLNPTNTNYYYYLHDINGKTYYAVTLEEHIANINNFL